MTTQEHAYDIFISYAHEDGDWVKTNLYDPLLRCRTSDNRRPRVFLDLDAISGGTEFFVVLANAIQTSRRVIPVYSKIYFQKEMTLWELRKAFQLDPIGKHGKLYPILIEPGAEKSIPFEVNTIQFLSTFSQDWFDKLIDNLALSHDKSARQSRLRFLKQPADTTINLTIPPVEIVIEDEAGAVDCDDEVSISAEDGVLHGTVTVKASQGKAAFIDLSFGEAARTCLTATSAGHEAVTSDRFLVSTTVDTAVQMFRVAVDEARKEAVVLRSDGDAFFFAEGAALAIREHDRILVHSIEGDDLGHSSWTGRTRLVRRGGTLMAFADWDGNVGLVENNGTARFFPCPCAEKGVRFTIPGDVSISDAVYIGYWNGRVYHLSMDTAPELLWQTDGGIQALIADSETLCAFGLDGVARVILRDGTLIQSHKLEPGILAVKAFDHRLVAIGRREIYQLVLDRQRVLSENLPFEIATCAMADVDRMIVMDSTGKGVRYDGDLAIRGRFTTGPGARPVSGDAQGRYCVFRYPDGSSSLMVGNRIVYSQSRGTVAVDLGGECFAFGSDDGIKILDRSALDAAIEADSGRG